MDGAFAVALGWKMHSSRYHRSWPYFLWGILGIIAGFIALLYPSLTALVLLTLIAFWAIVGGICQIIATINMRDAIDSFWSSLIFGVISIVFGVMIIGRPLEGLVAMAWLIGFYAVVVGCMFISVALRLRKMQQ